MRAIIRAKATRTGRRIRPAPNRTIAPRGRANTITFGAWESRSELSMIGLRSGVDEDGAEEVATGSRAVGVLGSDRYDKLLILQALRSLLPNAVFFTTDLDALVLHPTARPYTRNLLVASSFGLHLDDDLQREIPPFRSSYQTAAFFAAQAAVKGADGQPCTWNEPALLFEVGLSSLFQISIRNERQAEARANQRVSRWGGTRSTRTHRRCFRRPAAAIPSQSRRRSSLLD